MERGKNGNENGPGPMGPGLVIRGIKWGPGLNGPGPFRPGPMRADPYSQLWKAYTKYIQTPYTAEAIKISLKKHTL